MSQRTCLIALVLVPAALAALGTRRSGWLDRVVLYHKQKLFNELRELAPIQISAEIQQKPIGYVDSTEWDYDSVTRLLTLLRASETAKPVHKALRRMLQPSRRLMMSIKKSKQRFPSIKPDNNEFYYDGYSSSAEQELPAPPPVPEDQVVLTVSNPVEARLPSARISVKLLREILEARARAGRQMPTTKEAPWKEFVRNRTRNLPSSTEHATTQGAHKPDGGITSTKPTKPSDQDGNHGISTSPANDNATPSIKVPEGNSGTTTLSAGRESTTTEGTIETTTTAEGETTTTTTEAPIPD